MLRFLSVSDVPLGDAALYAVIGFLVVIAVLALLVGIFYLSGAIFRTEAMSGEKLFARKKKRDSSAPASEPEESEDGETIAAITAAIAVMLSEESGDDATPEFVIRRVSRKK